MKINISRIVFILMVSQIPSLGQSDYELQPREKVTFSRYRPIIKKAILMYEQNNQFTILAECENITKSGQIAYAEVFDSLGKRIEEFDATYSLLEPGQTSFELIFDFKLKKNNYSVTSIQSAYINISIGNKPFSGIKPYLGSDFKFNIRRMWMISESENSKYHIKILAQNRPIVAKKETKSIIKDTCSNVISGVSIGGKKPIGPGKNVDHYLINIPLTIGNLFEDGNPETGIFYYLPSSYKMWDVKAGKFNIDIQNGQGVNIDKTIITATPKPFIDPQDISIVKDWLRTKTCIKDLRLMPWEKIEPFIGDLTGLDNTYAKDVNISPPDRLEDPVYVRFSTTSFETFASQLFKNTGLKGTVRVTPDGPNNTDPRPISFNLSLKDPITTYGRITLDKESWRKEIISNPTRFYPIKLEKFSILYDETDALKTYEWSFESTDLPAKAKFNLDHVAVPQWIDTAVRVKKIWIDYSIPDCYSCNEKVKEQITAKLEKTRKRIDVVVQIFDAFEYSKARQIRVKLKSYLLNATGTARKDEAEVTLLKDGDFKPIGPLMVGVGQTLAYEYLIELTKSDGDRCYSGWIKGNDTRIDIGSSQIKEKISCAKK